MKTLQKVQLVKTKFLWQAGTQEFPELFISRPVKRGECGEVTPGPATFGASPSLKNIKYTRMRHFKQKNSKIFFSERPTRMFL